jgi:hypothetical protein
MFRGNYGSFGSELEPYGVSVGSPRHLPPLKQAWARTLVRQTVVWIAQGTDVQRKAAAADAIIEPVSKLGQPKDALLNLSPPQGSQSLPVLARRRVIVGKRGKHSLNFAQGYARALRHPDECDAAQDAALKSALVARVSPTRDQTLLFVEMDCRDGQA